MSASYACQQCRRHLFSKLRHRSTAQWQPRAGFISLAKAQELPIADSRQQLLDILEPSADNGANKKKKPATKKRLSPVDSEAHKGDLLEAYFEQGLQSAAPRRSTTTSNINTIDSVYRHIETLKSILNTKPLDLGAAWTFFVENLGPNVWAQNGIDPRSTSYMSCAHNLLLTFTRERSKHEAAPDATDVVAVYTTMGMMRTKDFKAILNALLDDLFETCIAPPAVQEGLVNQSARTNKREKLVNDVLGVWRALLIEQNPELFGVKSGNSRGWTNFNPDFKAPIVKKDGRVGAHWVFGLAMLPQHEPTYVKSIFVKALRTFSMLADGSRLPQGGKIKEHIFMRSMARILALSQRNTDELKELLSREDSYSKLKSGSVDWNNFWKVVEELDATPIPQFETRNINIQPIRAARPIANSSMSYNHELQRTLYARDTNAADKLWTRARFASPGTKASEAHAKRPVLTHELCNHFIKVFMALRQPTKAVEVWNYMVEASMEPKASTWNAMLDGCKTCRDSRALQEVWTRLINSGTTPDMICWTTRISGLIECGQPEEGIRALEHMGRLWRTAVEKTHGKGADFVKIGDVGTAVKPTIATINAAIAGLLRRKNELAANRVLAWGGNLGIKPDLITYNTLLRPFVRSGRTEAVQQVLDHMQRDGIQADVATFTTILDETFRASEDMTPEEQIEVVDRIFSEMEGAGVHANLHTYGKVLYSLLQIAGQDMSAVEAVLSRMAKDGLKPNSYIYTMIVGHHFSATPPDLEAIRGIIERVRFSPHIVDHIFWDRVIEGYARLGDTGTALTILGREDKDGKRVGWFTMATVLNALAENDEWDLARQVVMNVKVDRGGPPPAQMKGVEGQHEFWRLVGQLNLMNA